MPDNNNVKQRTILQQLLINIVAPLILFILSYSAYNYYREREKLSEQLKNQVTQLTLEIKNLVDLYDQGMIAHEEAIGQRMKDKSIQIYEYEKKTGVPLNIQNLYELSATLGMDTLSESIYIIDTNCVVCNTTFIKDKNLDFIKIDPKFRQFFNGIRHKNVFHEDRFGLEMQTKKIKKYSFLTSHTGRFLIELGFYSKKADALHELLLQKVASSSSHYSSFNEVKFDAVIKDVHSFIFDKKYDSIVNKAIATKEEQTVVENRDGLKITNRFIFLDIKNAGLYNGYVIQIVTDNKLEKELLTKELFLFLKLLLLVITPLILIVIYRARGIIKPLKQLSEKANIISKGNLHEKADVLGAHEIAELSRNFNHMVDELRESYEGLEQKVRDRTQEITQQKHIIEEKNKEITDSINYAQRIQRALLASENMLNNNLNDYFVFFKPKDIVSGDFYWAASQDNKFYLVTADSTGHGVPGAIMSMLNISCLNEAINGEGLKQPDDILNFTRKKVIGYLANDGSKEGGKDGMDCSILCLDLKEMNLSVSAANNPVWIVRSGEEEVIEVKPDKMPVGKHDKQDIPFQSQNFKLNSGDIIYTLTDGFPDQFGGEKGKKFMSKNLRELLKSNSGLAMDQQKNLLEETFKNWVGDLEQIDDVTVIGIRI